MASVDKIVMLNGVPRSGTSWLGQILSHSEFIIYRYQPLYSWEFKNEISLQSSKEDILKATTRIVEGRSDFVTKGLSGCQPSIDKTHADTLLMKHVRYHYLLPHMLETLGNKLQVILMVRDPRACLSSWSLAEKEVVEPVFDSYDEWYFGKQKNQYRPEEYYGFHKWKEYTTLAIDLCEQYPDQCTLICYEELVSRPQDVVRHLCSRIGIAYLWNLSKYIEQSTAWTATDTYSLERKQADLNTKAKRIISLVPEDVNERIVSELSGTSLETFLIS